jgi:hypothetical protein
MANQSIDESLKAPELELLNSVPVSLDFFGDEDDDLDGGQDSELDAEEVLVLEWVRSATGLIELLVENSALELEPDADKHELAVGLAPFMAEEPANAAAVAEWILDADGVVDFFLTDRELHKILKKW